MFLGERYELQERMVSQTNGMAHIHYGGDIYTGHKVAIKVLRDIYYSDPKFVARFQDQASTARSLQHPNIVQVYDSGESNGLHYMAMELVKGVNLRHYLRIRGKLATDRTVTIAQDVAYALREAHHQQIVHEGINPHHILVGRDGIMKLIAFGKASGPGAPYFAPEQVQGEMVTPATDVYALGIVMYEMLVGHVPFDGDTPVAIAMQHIHDEPTPPRQINQAIPQPLEEIILCCLEKVPERRYRDGAQLAQVLEQLSKP